MLTVGVAVVIAALLNLILPTEKDEETEEGAETSKPASYMSEINSA